MRSADYTHNMAVMASLSQFYTINSGIEIDLSGQVNAEVAGGRYLGAVGGYVDYVRGGLLERASMHELAHDVPGPDQDFDEMLDLFRDKLLTSA